MLRMHRRLPVFLAFAAVLFLSAPLLAQNRPYYQGQGWLTSEGQYRAYDKGYQKGEDQGKDDAKDNRAFDYARDKDYRNADNGYKDRYGARLAYANEFRRGYVAGYTQAYNRYAPRGYYGNGGYAYPGYEGRAVPRPGGARAHRDAARFWVASSFC